MPERVWISLELTHAIHPRQLAEHGGIEGVHLVLPGMAPDACR